MTGRIPQLLLALATLLPAAGRLHAQTTDLKLKVRMSADSQAEDKRQPRSFFRMSDKNLMVMRVRDEGPGVQPFERMSPRFELYDRGKLGVVRQQEPVLKVRSGMVFLEDLVLLGGKPVMIAARRDTVAGFVEVYWQHLDPNLTKYHPPMERLAAFDAKVLGTGEVIKEGNAFRDPFYTALSPDTNMMLIHAPVVVGIDGRNRHLMVMVDQGMDVKWQRVVDVPATSRFQDVQVDNMGNAYLVMHEKAKVSDRKDTTQFALRISMVNGDDVTPVETDGIGKDRHIKSLRFLPMNDGRIAVGGIHGGLDGRGNPSLSNFIAFVPPGEAKLDLLSNLKIDFDPEDAWMAKDMRLVSIIARPKGGFYLVNEYWLQTDQPHTKFALSGLRWVHGPVMAIATDKEGKEQWTSVFRRLHLSWDRRVGELFALEHNDRLVLFMLDSDELAARRKKNDKEQSHLEMKQPYSVYVQFDDKGQARAKGILRTGGANDFIQGTQLFRVAKNEYYVLGSSKLGGNKLLPVKIELLD